MYGHGATGRTFAGRVLQVVTGSTGLDDYEWGVTLFAVHPDDLKEVVYTMRFDEASALYAEFGPFYTGLVAPVEEVLDDRRLALAVRRKLRAHRGAGHAHPSCRPAADRARGGDRRLPRPRRRAGARAGGRRGRRVGAGHAHRSQGHARAGRRRTRRGRGHHRHATPDGDEVGDDESDDEGAFEIELPGPGPTSPRSTPTRSRTASACRRRAARASRSRCGPNQSRPLIFQLGARERSAASRWDRAARSSSSKGSSSG